MAFNFALSALVNAAGAFLFLLVGIGILAVGRRRALLVGLVAVFFGLTHIFENLVIPTDRTGALVILVSPVVLVVAEILFVRDIVRSLPRAHARRLVAYSFANVAVVILLIVGAERDTGSAARSYGGAVTTSDPVLSLALLAIFASWSGLLVAASGLALQARRSPEASRQRALLLASLSIGLYAAFVTTFVNLTRTSPAFTRDPFALAGFGGQLLMIAIATLFFFPAPALRERRLLRAAFLSIVLAGLAGCAFALMGLSADNNTDLGSFGVIRTIGAALLVIAIARYDLLGVPLPHLAEKRGALAAGALALLFVTAQIAQNFLAAQYGLLMGGVVAGAFLFAAAPLQRAMESMREGPAARRDQERRGTPSPSGDARREAAYRKSARWAMRDGRISRDEEIHLHELALQLGLDGRRAHEILVEVERETKMEGS